MYRWRHHHSFSYLYTTSRFHVAVNLLSRRSLVSSHNLPANNALVGAGLRERPRSVCSACQNVARTSVTHSAIVSCATFLFLLHSDGICDPLLIDARQNESICQAAYLHNEGSLPFASNAVRNSSQQVIMSSRSIPLHSTISRTTWLMLDGW